MTVYLSGRFTPATDAAVSPSDRGFLFADGVYEVIRSYGGRLFELGAHLERLGRSLREIRIDPQAADGLGGICAELLDRCGLKQAESLVYIQITRGSAPRRHPFPPEGTKPTVYASAAPFDPPVSKMASGVSVLLVPDTRWSRCDIKSIALLPNVLARQMAEDYGAEEAVFLRDGIVTEGASSTFCVVLSGTLVTHPESNVILPGITRKVVLRLCYDLGIPSVERPIREDDLGKASELMLLSTTREIMPVVAVDGTTIGGGSPGRITRRLQDAFRRLTGSP
jgi:D-alanine transaminase